MKTKAKSGYAISFRTVAVIAMAACIAVPGGCAGGGKSILPVTQSGTRPFYMGMSAFPWAYSAESIEWNFDRIEGEADLVAHHMDNGIPWDVCLSGAPLPQNIIDALNHRKERTPAGHGNYVAVTPLDTNRAALAPLWNAAGDNQPLPSPWSGYAFNHPNVKAAYLEYCRRIINILQPDYLNIAIEANLLAENSPAKWDAFMELHRHVYTALKTDHPELVIMVSMTGIDLVEGYTGSDHAAQTAAFTQLMEYSDYFGISLHPHLTLYAPDLNLPLSMFDDIFSLSDKPACICETSFPAERLSITAPRPYSCNGTPEKQRQFMGDLLSKAREHNLRFVVNYLVRDYDRLCEDLGWTDGMLVLWRDTGLYDGDGVPRPAHTVWMDWLFLPVKE